MSEEEKDDNYDSEPVLYCSTCLSLKIKYEEAIDSDCCGKCGSTDIKETTMEEWEKMYLQKYGHRFVQKSNDISKSPIFQLPLKELKKKVFYSSRCEEIIKELYGYIPKGVSKIESVMLLFDKLIKDSKLNALRTLLYRMKI